MRFPRIAQYLHTWHTWLGAWHDPMRFVLLFTPFSVAVPLVFILPIAYIDPAITQSGPDMSGRAIQLYGVFGAPIAETIITQWAIFELARLCRAPAVLAFIVTWLGFAALHWSNGTLGLIGGGVLSGFFLCWVYALWRQRSRTAGFCMTVACHALHNLLLFTAVRAATSMS